MGRYFYTILMNSILVKMAILGASTTLAYPTPVDFDGQLLRWRIDIDDGPITYEISAENENDILNFQLLVGEAAAIWNDVPNSYFMFSPAADDQEAQVTINLQREFGDAAFSAGFAIFDEIDAENGPIHCSISINVNTDRVRYG